MKLIERRRARILRSKGYSLKQITRALAISKSTASLWVRDVSLTPKQVNRLKARHTSIEVIESRRQTRLRHEMVKRAVTTSIAAASIKRISRRDLWILGIGLYWGEGRKTNHGLVGFSNGDPKSVQIMMRFFKEICAVPEKKFRGHIHIHGHLDHRFAEHYWSKVSGIPLKQFYKTYRKRNRNSKGKRDSLPYGTFDIVICDTRLLLSILGWIEGVTKASLGT